MQIFGHIFLSATVLATFPPNLLFGLTNIGHLIQWYPLTSIHKELSEVKSFGDVFYFWDENVEACTPVQSATCSLALGFWAEFKVFRLPITLLTWRWPCFKN